MAEKNICPGCGRQCDLSEPHCGRGEAYRRTREMPQQQHGKEYQNETGHSHGKESYHETGRPHGKESYHETGHPHGKECYHETGHLHGKGSYYEMRKAYYQAADTNEKLIINLRDLSHIMRFLYEGKASQKRILIILNESKKMTQRDLTERLGIQPGSASEILSKLESAGLILRTPSEADRRTTDICLTDSGRKVATEASARRQKQREEMFSCLSKEERQELLSLLEKVCADWNSRYSEGNAHGYGRHHDAHGSHDGHGRHGHFAGGRV